MVKAELMFGQILPSFNFEFKVEDQDSKNSTFFAETIIRKDMNFVATPGHMEKRTIKHANQRHLRDNLNVLTRREDSL